MGPTTRQRGIAAEENACRHLQGHGLQLIERNYRSPHGEIDLIMREGRTTVFVEVRLRNNPAFGSGADSVTARKQAKITATALHYLQQHTQLNRHPARFDVVSINDREQTAIEWIKNAFQAG